MEKTIQIEGMHCKNCATSVTKALEAVAGVSAAVIDLTAKTAAVTLTAPVENAALREAIEDIGFDVMSIA